MTKFRSEKLFLFNNSPTLINLTINIILDIFGVRKSICLEIDVDILSLHPNPNGDFSLTLIMPLISILIIINQVDFMKVRLLID